MMNKCINKDHNDNGETNLIVMKIFPKSKLVTCLSVYLLVVCSRIFTYSCVYNIYMDNWMAGI